MPSALRRSVVVALLPLAAGAAVAATTSPAVAGPVSAQEPQVCQYSYDQNWRMVPVTLTGTLKDATTGTELVAGETLAPGQRIRLEGATVQAELPGWIGPFAFDGGVIANGIGSVPVHGWIALEATNTAEGTTAPIPIAANAISHANVPDGNAPTEETAYFDPVTAAVADQTWTATGGDVVVRQAVATKMAPIPAGRDGNPVQVNGSLFVAAQLDASTRLYLDCLPGGQLANGATHSDKLPNPLTSVGFRVPGFTTKVDGAPVAGATDAVLENAGLRRAAAGQTATVTGSRLRLRGLTPTQRSAWLGASGSAQVGGTVTLHGARSTQSTQTVSLTPTSVLATGTDDIVLDLADSTWTPDGTTGVDIRGDRTITLTATNGGDTRTLQLERITGGDAYPFTYVLGPDPRTRFEDDTPDGGGGPTTTNPPLLGGGTTFAPPPVLQRKTTIKIASSSLKRSRGTLKVKLTNLSRTAATKGHYKLVTTSKYRVGKSKAKRAITLVPSKAFTLKKGKSATFTVKLSKDATTLLKSRRSVKAKLTVTPALTKTQTTVTRTVTVRR